MSNIRGTGMVRMPLCWRWWTCLVVIAVASSAAGCTATSAPPSTSATTATVPAVVASATFDAQAIADLSGDAYTAAIESLSPEQLAEVGAIVEAQSQPPTVVTPPPKKVYKALSSRGFKQVAKDPDSYIGRTYIVYGEITQFDSATGVDTFRADLGYKKLRPSYGYVNYPQNAMLNGTESRLAKYVQGDLFTAKVTVLGSYSYDTQSGGNTTVPSFQVDSISRYGSVD